MADLMAVYKKNVPSSEWYGPVWVGPGHPLEELSSKQSVNPHRTNDVFFVRTALCPPDYLPRT